MAREPQSCPICGTLIANESYAAFSLRLLLLLGRRDVLYTSAVSFLQFGDYPASRAIEVRCHIYAPAALIRSTGCQRVLPVLISLSEQARHCNQRVIECGRKAFNASTEEARDEYLGLQRDWLALARRYQIDGPDVKRQRLDRRRGLEAGARHARGSDGNMVPLLSGQAFSPEAVAELSNAFDRVCTALMVSAGEAKAEQIARKIIELGQRGLRESTQLFYAAIQEVDLRD